MECAIKGCRRRACGRHRICEPCFDEAVAANIPPWATEEDYVFARNNGHSPRAAVALIAQDPPGAMTDSVFMEGHCCGNQFEKRPDQGDFYARIARRAGVSITGKVYKSGLARFPGDPEAWVSSRGEVESVIRRRPGWTVEGAVKAGIAGSVLNPQEVPLAPDILAAEVEKEMAKNPDQRAGDVAEKLTELRTPHWQKRKPAKKSTASSAE